MTIFKEQLAGGRILDEVLISCPCNGVDVSSFNEGEVRL
jgi:hypothetical protein